jgi:hypothetical protein
MEGKSVWKFFGGSEGEAVKTLLKELVGIPSTAVFRGRESSSFICSFHWLAICSFRSLLRMAPWR